MLIVSVLTKKENEMERYPLKEIKDLLNEIAKLHAREDIPVKAIGNYSQLMIIKYLIDHEGEDIYQKHFERMLNVRKSTISGILDTMEKNKIINRVSSPRDGREKLIKLSNDSLKRQSNLLKILENTEKLLTEDIEEKDLKTFFSVLDKMKENIKRKENKDV